MAKASWGAIGIIVVLQLASGRVHAQEAPVALGAAHQLVVSGERLFGYAHGSVSDGSVFAGGGTTKVSSFSLLGNTLSLYAMFSLPHVAVDYFALRRFSIGGCVAYFRAAPEEEPAGPETTSYWGYTIAVRTGLSAPLGRRVIFWPRVGFAHVHVSSRFSTTLTAPASPETTIVDTDDANLYALTVEAPFALMLAPHFFVSAAATLDLGLGGTAILNERPAPAKETDFGASFGLGGFI
jgi:hypothetical protein